MATIYYQDTAVTLWHGRCEDVLPTIPGSTVDLVLTDPPYGTTNLSWDQVPDLAWLWGALGRVSTPAAVQALFSAQPFTTDLIASNRANYRYELIWEKAMGTQFFNAGWRPLQGHENIEIFCKHPHESTYHPQKTPGQRKKTYHGRGRADHYNAAGSGASVVEDRHPLTVLPVSNGHGGRSDHPSQKPMELICWLMATYSNPDDLVLDLYGGRGTTAWAAKKLGRRCIIIEAEERYCEIAARGLAQEVMDLAS